ncbi:NUMOD4 domain-containing protein [Peribacillus frigoritolerans]|nr:NUMOD4 domain-containing protein [Peribacillus frigoritolerans]
MKEQWKAIKCYEGLYEISNHGRVRSLDRVIEMKNGVQRPTKGQMLKPTKDQHGYLKVHLSMEDTKKMFRVHQLVALHFIDNPNGYTFVNRLNKDLTNNRADNLYWETPFVSLGNAGKIGGKISKRGKARKGA